jgi:hypothetical protein
VLDGEAAALAGVGTELAAMPKSHDLVAALRRPRWSAGDARTVLAAVDRSGLSIAAFAAREGLDVQRLYSNPFTLGVVDRC